MSILIALLTALGLFLLWVANNASIRNVDHAYRVFIHWQTWLALTASLFLGYVVGAFYGLFDFPLVWP